MILCFPVQLVEKLGGAEPPQSEKWEGLSPPCPPYISAPVVCSYLPLVVLGLDLAHVIPHASTLAMYFVVHATL